MKVRLYGIPKLVNRPIMKSTEQKKIVNKFQKGSREVK